ncbi:MAG: RNA-directed DNA polymerase [Bacteroidetes bacterium]|uniref:RNA-directed DNA polymerase n=1 Tax=Candidatus Gallipaludibacter merdavium TaxID=2840839 RepID=A0A9D9HRB6_9BACT|nr:RNA-directed DNA polymerase [Candidatus Gallipaludibacter merdavium]
MDKTEIVQIASRMSTREDLLTLLNRIRQDEIRELGGDADKFYPFTMKQLLYYCNPNHVFHRYRQFKIKKKSGGFRQITAPRNQSYMMLLRSVNEILKAVYTPSNYAMGFTEKRSVVTNATMHKSQNYVFNIDLKDFFPSIEQGRVMKRLTLAPFNFSPQIALLISGLCSMRVKREQTIETKQHDLDKQFMYVLPQGAPTSPIITNMICDTLDRKLAGLAKRFGICYTRYADDITFSSMHYVYSKNGEFIKELTRIINSQGFVINEIKTRLQKLGSRQEVTGIIVSKKLNVTKKYVREIRSLLYIWDRYGYSEAMSRFFPKYKMEKGHIKKGNPELANVLDGKLIYLKMVKGDADSVYARLHTKFQGLVNRDFDSDKTNSYGITYIESLPLLEFEKDKNTNIIIHSEESNKRYAIFKIGETNQIASINKDVALGDEQQKEKLAISYCRNSKRERFWLIHLLDKVTVFKQKTVDIDELNNELDLLLST